MAPCVWKIAPGEHAEDWAASLRYRCIGLGWGRLRDFRQLCTIPDVYEALDVYRRRGELRGNGSGAARSIWQFAWRVRKGDIVVANDGRGAIMGLGLITSRYLTPRDARNPVPRQNPEGMFRRHVRRVDWVVNQRLELPNRHTFAIDTVTLLREQQTALIRGLYSQEYPALAPVLDQLFDDEQILQLEEPEGHSAVEGHWTEHRAFRRGRSRRLRDEAMRGARGVCEACNVNYGQLLGGRGARVLQVHHRHQLSSLDQPMLNSVQDLAVVCANCHALLHADPDEAMDVQHLRELLQIESEPV